MDPSSTPALRVAYTLEQCWHDSPGGTAIAALRIAREFLRDRDRRDGDRGDGDLAEIELKQVAGKHATVPPAIFRPEGAVAMLPIARPLLYETWTRLNWPKVESVTGPVDVAHATGLVPCATAAPLVVTVHDVAFVHSPEKFTKHGARSMQRSLEVIRRRAARVLCPSQATIDDLHDLGFGDDRLRFVPLGVDVITATTGEVEHVSRHFDLPERFVLFVGTLEPRKNLRRLVDAMRIVGVDTPLVVAGAGGWGDERERVDDALSKVPVDVRFLGTVSDAELRGLYAAATVFAYPSEREGFGLPVAEAMAQGTAVVTSRGTSTEEVAGGAAVLVDPFDVDDIARGIREARDRAPEMAGASRRRAGELSWTNAARATAAVYRELVR